MKLQLDSPGSLNTVTSYGDDFVDVGGVRHARSVIVFPEGQVRDWIAKEPKTLQPEDFALVFDFEPEILVLGTGMRQRFLHPRVVAQLGARRIGVETMDTPAACRTYNILVAEGRKVAAALMVENPTDA